MTVKFEIRPALAADKESLAALEAQTLRETYAENHPDEVERHIRTTVEHLTDELEAPEYTTLLGLLGGVPIGYATLLTGAAPASVTGDAPIELFRLYLKREHIGRGYGSALMRAGLEEAAKLGCDTIWVGVWEENARARSFYRKWGFRDCGRHEFEFGGTRYEDLVMARRV